MTPGPAPWRGLALICSAGVIWGTIGPAVDVVTERTSLSVLTTGAYRAIAAVVALAVAVLVSGRFARCVALVRAHPLRCAAVGALTAAFQVLFFVAVIWVGVSIATVVCLGFAPVFLLAVSSVRQRGPPPGPEIATVGTAVAGLLLVSLAGGGDPDPARPLLGVVAALGSGAAFALSAEAGRPLSQSHDALAVAAATMTVAGALLVLGGLPLAAARGEAMTTADVTSWLLIAYLGVGTMALAYVLLFAGLRTTPSGTAVIATLLEPLTAVAIAVAFLGEQLSLAGAIGSLLILAAIGTLGRRRPSPVPH